MPAVRRLRVVVIAMALALSLGACGGSDADGSATKQDAPRQDPRQAGQFSDGTAVCIFNRSADVLSITIINSESSEDGYGDVSGTANFPPGAGRCMRSHPERPRARALATVTIASGEQFQLSGFNNPLPGRKPWIEVNNDIRELEAEDTTDFKIGKHPIEGVRLPNEEGWVFFAVWIS